MIKHNKNLMKRGNLKFNVQNEVEMNVKNECQK